MKKGKFFQTLSEYKQIYLEFDENNLISNGV